MVLILPCVMGPSFAATNSAVLWVVRPANHRAWRCVGHGARRSLRQGFLSGLARRSRSTAIRHLARKGAVIGANVVAVRGLLRQGRGPDRILIVRSEVQAAEEKEDRYCKA